MNLNPTRCLVLVFVIVIVLFNVSPVNSNILNKHCYAWSNGNSSCTDVADVGPYWPGLAGEVATGNYDQNNNPLRVSLGINAPFGCNDWVIDSAQATFGLQAIQVEIEAYNVTYDIVTCYGWALDDARTGFWSDTPNCVC
jgi:hypothetical protein